VAPDTGAPAPAASTVALRGATWGDTARPWACMRKKTGLTRPELTAGIKRVLVLESIANWNTNTGMSKNLISLRAARSMIKALPRIILDSGCPVVWKVLPSTTAWFVTALIASAPPFGDPGKGTEGVDSPVLRSRTVTKDGFVPVKAASSPTMTRRFVWGISAIEKAKNPSGKRFVTRPLPRSISKISSEVVVAINVLVAEFSVNPNMNSLITKLETTLFAVRSMMVMEK